MRSIYFLYFFLSGLLICGFSNAQVRSVIDFNKGWAFFLGNDSLAINTKFDDSHWRRLTLPHDWSIESNFSQDYPATNQGGALPGGIGWYRKTFTLPSSSKNKNVSIEFDGIYKNSEVWINGHYLGKRPNGYVSFSYDLTPFILPAPQKNIIAVKVDNSLQPDSRWYTGSGIYRNVKLLATNSICFDTKSIFVTIPVIKDFEGTSIKSDRVAILDIQGIVKVDASSGPAYKVIISVFDKDGKQVLSEKYFAHGTRPPSKFHGQYIIPKPNFWSVDNPLLYKLKLELFDTYGTLIDKYEMTFGIRSFYFDKDKGFFLNNQPLKIKGVCMHHDLGALGAAFNISAAKRQLKLLKEMGCNAIRFSHNPPASELLDLCDQMGFLVIDEAFDMWQKRKNKFDYHLDFKEWYKKDIEAMILRDRNHPSVILWSIGNEIREQFDSTGTILTKELVATVKNLDPTRPVTSALTETFPEKNFVTKANALDVLGFNYKDYDYLELPKRFPGQKFIASETASALETRSVYEFPSDSIRVWPPNSKVQDTFTGNKNFTSSAFDNTHAYWGNTHERSWLAVKRNQHIAGAFVWSGFDYLGEPAPYPKFPARSSYYGIIDLAGFPKDVYYMYQSEWSGKPVLHIFPHWNWTKGEMIDIWAYYNNADEVELYLNGRSVGTKKKTDTSLHVVWRIPFEAGKLKAVSRKNGKIVLTKEIKTAGKPARIKLMADRSIIRADGKDLSFITARILDKEGNLVPDADNLLEFSVTGNGVIAGTDNGFQADTVSLKNRKRKCWKGMALVIVQSSEKKGNITLTAKSPGLTTAARGLKNID